MSSNRLFGLCLLIIAASAQAQTKIPFKPIKAGVRSNATKASEAVIRTPEAFDAYWEKNFGTAPKPKGIDWSNSAVVAIHLGHRGSRAYSASVSSVVQQGDDTVVTWTERIPSAKALQTPSKTSPFVIASIPNSVGNVVFKSRFEEPGNPFSDGNVFPIKKLLSGGHCMVKEATNEVIDDSSTLNELWPAAFGKNSAPPKMDFKKWRYVAIFLGQCPTPGYEIVVKRIARIGPNEVTVMFTETKPAKGAIEPQMITNPFVILQLPRTDDTVTVTAGGYPKMESKQDT